MEVATLTTTCAEVSTYWSRDILDIDIGWRITVFLLLIIFINVLGVKVRTHAVANEIIGSCMANSSVPF